MAGNDRESGAAPVQVRGTVLTVRRVDAYVAMTVVAPAIATRFRPGQFIAIAVGGPQSGVLGRRAISLHDVPPYHGGTVAVLRTLCVLPGRYGLPVQALVSEPTLTCGTGLCLGCVLPAVGNDGITRMVRACVDGPMFRGDLVRWDDVGTIPFDALGAPGWKPRPAAGGAGPVTEGRSHVG